MGKGVIEEGEVGEWSYFLEVYMVITEDTDVEVRVGVGVRGTDTRREGVDRWVVRGFSEPRSVCPCQIQESRGY